MNRPLCCNFVRIAKKDSIILKITLAEVENKKDCTHTEADPKKSFPHKKVSINLNTKPMSILCFMHLAINSSFTLPCLIVAVEVCVCVGKSKRE